MFSLITSENLRKAFRDPVGVVLFIFGINRFFSQAGEDMILNGLLYKNNGLYIDIGANDPIRGSNTYFFYKKGWRGVNVEPNKKMIARFLKKRPEDTNLQIGIGKLDSNLEFFVFREHQMSTCDPETAKRYTDAGYKIVDTYTVPVLTLEHLCDQYVKNQEIDILSVDVEGFDMDVLQSNNWEKYRPKYIILETVEYAKHGKNTWSKQNSTFDPYLKSKNYEVVAETGINTIYKDSHI